MTSEFKNWKPDDHKIPDPKVEPSWTIKARNAALPILLRRYARMLEREGADKETIREIKLFADECSRWNGHHGGEVPIDNPLPDIRKGALISQKT